MRNPQKYFISFFGLLLGLLSVGKAQGEDASPVLNLPVNELIKGSDSLRFRYFPEEYKERYQLISEREGAFPPVPFDADIFFNLEWFPEDGWLGYDYGKFRAHSIGFYDYGGVHFNQINLAEMQWETVDSVSVPIFREDDLFTVTLAYGFGRAWIRFDVEAESDNWLETFVEQKMKGFGPELSEIREGSAGESWVKLYSAFWDQLPKKRPQVPELEDELKGDEAGEVERVEDED